MIKRKRWVLVSVTICTLALIPALTGYAATELARINNSVITLEAFNKRYKENAQFFPTKTPTKKAFLEEWIKREIGIQEAKRLGLEKDPDVVDRTNTVLYNSLLERKLTKDFEAIHISNEEAKSYYDKNPEIRTSHIFVALRPDANATEQKKAYEKILKIRNENLVNEKKTFAEIAQTFSEGPAAAVGGDIGYQTRERLDPNYYETALKLKSPGKVSDIVRTQFGYHIIKLTAVRPWEDADTSQVKRVLFDEQRAKIFEKYMASLKSQANVAVHSELIKD